MLLWSQCHDISRVVRGMLTPELAGPRPFTRETPKSQEMDHLPTSWSNGFCANSGMLTVWKQPETFGKDN